MAEGLREVSCGESYGWENGEMQCVGAGAAVCIGVLIGVVACDGVVVAMPVVVVAGCFGCHKVCAVGDGECEDYDGV